ncbi:MAG: hypothetical protein ACFE9S_00915 [Candidatus Hermodarchaeota archaeon]
MQNNIIMKLKKHKIILVSLSFFLAILISAYFLSTPTLLLQAKGNDSGDTYLYDVNLKNSNGEDYIFQGIEDSLIINDTGNLYDLNQEISVSNQVELNISYYLDDIHEWKASKIQTNVRNIQDTREWVKNNDYYELDTPYRHYQAFSNIDPVGQPPHNYSADLDHDPTNPSNVHSTISNSSASAMRLHFSSIEIETDWDLLCVYDSNNRLQFTFTGKATDLFTPWMKGNTFKITINSDGSIQWYGYDIDFYEYYNSSTNYFDYETTWGYDNRSLAGNIGGNFGPESIDNNTAMYTTLLSEPGRDSGYPMDATYYENDFSEIYQNITIPRGSVIDGYISFDYYAESAMDSNENYIYCEINNQKIYSKGLGDIVEAGRNMWHHTGKIYLDLWSNTSKIFNDINNNNEFNISVGIKSGASVTYSGFDERFQQIFWFDNISLVLTTLCNSTQSDINLTINGEGLINDSNWGISHKNFTGSWETNPIYLSVQTDSPSLEFNLDTVIYGYHESTSRIGQTTQEGVSYQILPNGSVYWEFTHNFFMPSQYSNFEFEIIKPLNWKFISALDPTFGSILFEGGDIGESYLRINKTFAIFPGWWTFRATSPNYINNSNTKMLKDGEWAEDSFRTGDSTRIKTQINNSNEIPANLDLTGANLTVYFPNGTLWFQESKTPFLNGTVIFSDITFTSENSVGGIYNYTIFWSNGTAIGGVKSNFIVVHDSYLTILKPDDAKLDNQTGGTVGDIIPLRVILRDAENGQSIPDAIISYNWSGGTNYLTDAALGIYEGVLDTSALGGFGLYNIIIQSNKIGFIDSNLTLFINLGENTNLQRLESDSKIVIHKNSTIRFFYYSEFDDEGISNAEVALNITNPVHYTIQDLSDGIYAIEFSTVFYNQTGVKRLVFEFTAIGYEPQIHIYQFEIIDPPSNPGGLPLWVLIILFASIGVGAIFAALSLRSYVIMPIRRKKEAELLAKTQRFKDLKNIQAIVIIHKLSGIPIFSKSYSILEKHKKELFSGFIQAITMIGEEFVEKDRVESEKLYGVEKMIELDFKQFYCLIADVEEIRTVFILRTKSSERMRNQISNLVLALNLKLSKDLEHWDGALDEFEISVPQIINEYFELYYKEAFKLSSDINLITMKKEKKLTKMELRVINVLQSMSRDNIITDVNNIVELVHEENKDLIIEAIESLIKEKIIIPFNN